MFQKELICIGCPMGCDMIAYLEENSVKEVAGNHCRKGKEYAQMECINPSRVITSTVKVIDGILPVVSVKTREAISKDKIFKCMEKIKMAKVIAPVHLGDTIIENAAETGINVIATREVLAKEG